MSRKPVKPPHPKTPNAAATAAAALAAARNALVSSHHIDPAVATLSLLANAWSSLAPSPTSSPAPHELLEDLPPVLDNALNAALDGALASLLDAFTPVVAQVAPSADTSASTPTFSLALALERIYEALLLRDASAAGSTRARLGAVYTPRPLALALTRDAWSRLAPAPHRPLVLDPSCGSGRFLLASIDVAAAAHAPLPILDAFDIDPCAVFITRALLHSHPLLAHDPMSIAPTIASRIRWCDALATPHAPNAFDLVLGNPPFLNQLERTSARAAAQARALTTATDGVIKGYADTASAFLHLAITLTRPGGVTCMIQPLSVLAARDSRPLRVWSSRTASLQSLWVGDTHAFAASVYACALTLRKRDHAPSRPRDPLPITLSRGVPPHTAARVRATSTTRWSVLASRACGVPNLRLDPHLPTLRTWLDATADFRDVYYALRDLIIDAPNPNASPSSNPNSNLIPILNTGLIELAATSWGRAHARLFRQRWLRPAFDLAQAQQHPFLTRVLPLRLRPKLILATQTRVIEAFVDAQGTWMPTTPLISLTPRDGAPDLYTIAAALCSPVATLVAARRTFGTSMSPRAIKLAAREVLDLPIPHDPAALAPAAHAFREAAASHANADHSNSDPVGYAAALQTYAHHAVAAYALPASDQDRILHWWHARRTSTRANSASNSASTTRTVPRL